MGGEEECGFGQVPFLAVVLLVPDLSRTEAAPYHEGLGTVACNGSSVGLWAQSRAILHRVRAIRSMLDLQPAQMEGDMTLRFIGTTSEHGNCPTLYEVVETGEILVQGERETDPEHLAQLRDVKDSETFVRVPRELLLRFAPRAEQPNSTEQTKE